MDQRPLVENQIDEGFNLVRLLVADGLDVSAAFWVLPREGEWTLYLASKVVDDSGTTAANRKVVDAWRKLEDPWVTISDITMIGERNPITQDVLAIMRKHPGPTARHLRRRQLSDLDIEEVYIYPPVGEAALRPPPHVRVVGVKRVIQGTTTVEAPEEVGYVDGFVGEAEFNTKLSNLIRLKFGSPEQFAAAYPRIILEEVAGR